MEDKKNTISQYLSIGGSVCSIIAFVMMLQVKIDYDKLLPIVSGVCFGVAVAGFCIYLFNMLYHKIPEWLREYWFVFTTYWLPMVLLSFFIALTFGTGFMYLVELLQFLIISVFK